MPDVTHTVYEPFLGGLGLGVEVICPRGYYRRRKVNEIWRPVDTHRRYDVLGRSYIVLYELLLAQAANLCLIEDEGIGVRERIGPASGLEKVGLDHFDFRMHLPKKCRVRWMLVDACYTDARFRLQPGDEVLADKPGCASNYYFLAHTFIRLKIFAHAATKFRLSVSSSLL